MNILIAKIIQVLVVIISPFLVIYLWKSLKKTTWYKLNVDNSNKGEPYGRSDKGNYKRKR